MNRYARNIAVRGFGEEGQQKLLDSKVLIVGCGALGSVCAMYLTAAGVGRIGLTDFDTIDITNLQRQVFYNETSLGEPKVTNLAAQMLALNSDIHPLIYDGIINNKETAREFIEGYDLVLECTDNASTKLLVSDTCAELGVPCIVGGVSEWTGQVMTLLPGKPTYRDVFGDAPACNGFTPCSAGGVIGPVPGIVATIQATEAIKVLTSLGKPLSGRLLAIDALTMDIKCWDI